RRCVLRAGGLGLLGLSRAGAAGGDGRPKDTAVIQVVLDGGPSHLETYDPKPGAPAEFRGEFGAIPSSLPGVARGRPFPRQARRMDRLAIVRSLHHATSDHSGGAHWIMTGHASGDATPRGNERPSVGSIAAQILGARRPGVPAYVGVPRTPRF